MVVYRCEDTLESVFTAIYQSYEEKRNHDDTLLCLTDDPILFAEDVAVQADAVKTRKVMNTLVRRFGSEDSQYLTMALAAEDEYKAQAVYRTVVEGLRRGTRPGHQKQFLRFQELETGVLYSRIGPKNDVLAFIMPHFSDRLPVENFLIYDEKRNLFGIHPAKKHWVLLHAEEAERPGITYSGEETFYQELFRQFCNTITIEERKNIKLQKGMLPLRFREYMVEFQ